MDFLDKSLRGAILQYAKTQLARYGIWDDEQIDQQTRVMVLDHHRKEEQVFEKTQQQRSALVQILAQIEQKYVDVFGRSLGDALVASDKEAAM